MYGRGGLIPLSALPTVYRCTATSVLNGMINRDQHLEMYEYRKGVLGRKAEFQTGIVHARAWCIYEKNGSYVILIYPYCSKFFKSKLAVMQEYMLG